jgi:hypothetical protein
MPTPQLPVSAPLPVTGTAKRTFRIPHHESLAPEFSAFVHHLFLSRKHHNDSRLYTITIYEFYGILRHFRPVSQQDQQALLFDSRFGSAVCLGNIPEMLDLLCIFLNHVDTRDIPHVTDVTKTNTEQIILMVGRVVSLVPPLCQTKKPWWAPHLNGALSVLS